MKKKFVVVLATLVWMSSALSSVAATKDTDPCANKMGVDSVETIKNLSMFNQYFKEKKYVESYPYWNYLFVNAPCALKRVTFNGPFIVKKYMAYIQETQGEVAYKARLNGLIDTILLTYPMRIAMFQEEGLVKGKWADDLAKLRPNQRGAALDLFIESINLEGNKSEYSVLVDFMVAAIKEEKAKKLSVDSVLMFLDIVTPIIDFNLVNDEKNKDKWIETQESVTKLVLPYLNCDKIQELKEPLFATKSEDMAYLQSTLKLLGRGGCEGTDFAVKLSEKLYKLEPNADAALSLANAFLKRGDEAKAFSYYEQAANGAGDAQKEEIYMKLSKLSLRANKYSQSRDYARKVLAINPNSGDAYMTIGDAYASSAGSCGGGVLKGREVYWAAVDKYAKARSVDASVTEEANKKIGKYSSYFPDKETAFFNSITDGQSFSVGCWIGESTTVRTISSN